MYLNGLFGSSLAPTVMSQILPKRGIPQIPRTDEADMHDRPYKLINVNNPSEKTL